MQRHNAPRRMPRTLQDATHPRPCGFGRAVTSEATVSGSGNFGGDPEATGFFFNYRYRHTAPATTVTPQHLAAGSAWACWWGPLRAGQTRKRVCGASFSRGFAHSPRLPGLFFRHFETSKTPKTEDRLPAEPTAWVLASSRNPRRGFCRAAGTHTVGSTHGTHAVGSSELPEPTPWVPASCRNPRRGFWPAAGTHAVGSGHLPEPTPWVLDTSQNPRRGFWTPTRTHAVATP